MSDLNYLSLPTIPVDFLRQMTAHLDVQTSVSERDYAVFQRLVSKNAVSINEYSQLFRLLIDRLGDEMLGFLGRPVPIGSLAALCHMLANSPSLYTAIEHYNRFYSLFAEDDKCLLDLSELRSHAMVSLNTPTLQASQPFFQQNMMLAVLKICCWLAGHKVSVRKLSFSFPAMPFDKEFSYLFGVTPSYNAPSTVIVFDPRELSNLCKPITTPEEFSDQCLETFLYWEKGSELTRRVYAEITHRLQNLDFSVERIAAAMAMSRHTLARRLTDEGTSYTELLDQVRKDKSKHLLVNSQEPVDHIAEMLGFAETSSFSRAFKRWTSKTPLEYRQSVYLAPK